ncbi:hypothetical protein VNO78_05506 [Psophocarpus tetragonolobus]|uniref:RING-type E3 ubiquitin transferase n=1 Tax=Psophocarpus tetragonolobus TaxID=3891 RepID=A0AAN9SQX8_PSOTE
MVGGQCAVSPCLLLLNASWHESTRCLPCGCGGVLDVEYVECLGGTSRGQMQGMPRLHLSACEEGVAVAPKSLYYYQLHVAFPKLYISPEFTTHHILNNSIVSTTFPPFVFLPTINAIFILLCVEITPILHQNSVSQNAKARPTYSKFSIQEASAECFVFRGSRGDIESGFSEYVPERTLMRVHPPRPVNGNSLAFLITVILIFMILNSPQMLHHFLLWVVLAIFVMATSLRMYATCQQLQAQARAHAAAASGLLGHTELRLHMPPSIAIATRGRLQGLRLQLALLDREFDELDYDTLRALDSDTASSTRSMTEEEINALPIHTYKVPVPPKGGSACLASSSGAAEIKQESGGTETGIKGPEDELTCTICLEQVKRGELIRSLPCLHQFHANCIDPWLRQQGTCPVCKLRIRLGSEGNRDSESDGSDIA